MEVCRICGGTEVLKCFLANKQLIELLKVCANIEAKEDDYLPKNICEQCEFGLRFSYRLRKQSEETEKRLRQEVMQTQAISTTTNDVTPLFDVEKQIQAKVTPIVNTTTTVTTTEQSSPIEVVGAPSTTNNNSANEQKAAQERQVSTSTFETADEQSKQQPVGVLNVQQAAEPMSERFRLELHQRGVVMSSAKVDIITEPTSTPQAVIAGKRIQLYIDDENANDFTNWAEEYDLKADNVGDDDVIEVIDDESMMQEPLPANVMDMPFIQSEVIRQQEVEKEAAIVQVADESPLHTNDYSAQDIIEEILSSDEDDEQLRTNITEEDDTLNKIVYEEGDEEYDDDYEESVGVNNFQTYITKEEREDITPYDDEATLDAEESSYYIENETIDETEANTLNFNSNAMENTITERISNYTCPTCNEGMESQRAYREHIKIHGKERFRCPECHKWFAQRYLLSMHKKTHRNDAERFVCPCCPLSYRKSYNLKRHIRSKHESPVHVCNICGESFGRPDILKRHMLIHSDQRDFQCHMCPEQFKTKQGMDRHIVTHGKDNTNDDDGQQTKIDGKGDAAKAKSYSCHYCGKISKHHHTHKMHMRTHTQERPHQCEPCGKSFRTLAALITHERVHDDARPYQCEHCLLSFKQSGHLADHRKIHEGIRPHVCSICNLSFLKKYNMNVHMRIHSGENPYKCVTCGEQFRKSMQLRKHERNVHNKIIDGESKETTEEEGLLQDANSSQEGAFEIDQIVEDEDAEIVEDLEMENNHHNETATSFANLATRLLGNDSDDLEIIENVSPPPPPPAPPQQQQQQQLTAEQIACNEAELEKVIGAGLVQSFSNVLPEDFHIDNNDVVLVVDDNDNFSSLFIMDD